MKILKKDAKMNETDTLQELVKSTDTVDKKKSGNSEATADSLNKGGALSGQEKWKKNDRGIEKTGIIASPGQKKNKKFKFKFKKKTVKRLIKVAIFLVVVGVGAKIVISRLQASTEEETVITTAAVETRTIQNVLTSSGTIEPLAEYDIATLVEGEIIAADFEVGDTVEEGATLYKISTDDVEDSIDSANTTLTRAEKSYEKAVTAKEKKEEKYQDAQDTYQDALADLEEAEADYDTAVAEYNEAKSAYDNLNFVTDVAGTISTVYVKAGDSVQKGTSLVDIYNDDTMLLSVPFNNADVKSSWVGKTATVSISGSFETVSGKVTEIDDQTSVLSGNQIVRYVTIEITNPGGVTTSTKATATISGISSNSEGTFSYGVEETITADRTGELSEVTVKVGNKVKKNGTVAVIDSDCVDDQIATYESAVTSAENTVESAQKTVDSALSSVSDAKDAVESAQDSIDDAQDSIDDAQSALEDSEDSLTDCYITSPVTGIVVQKNMLKGDVIGTSNFSSTLAVIYDLSSVTFEMYVDELDVQSVSVGQEVNITADALDGVEITGYVTNVSLVSTTSGGVTQYPVTVRIDEVGDLLPGMNVTGEIIVEESENVLAVPTDAIMRNNMVYVKDDSVTEADGDVPAGFKAVEVETGLSDGDYIEITSGLSEGEEVYEQRATTSDATSSDSSLFDLGGITGSSSSSGGGGGMPSGGSGGGGGQPSGGGRGM